MLFTSLFVFNNSPTKWKRCSPCFCRASRVFPHYTEVVTPAQSVAGHELNVHTKYRTIVSDHTLLDNVIFSPENIFWALHRCNIRPECMSIPLDFYTYIYNLYCCVHRKYSRRCCKLPPTVLRVVCMCIAKVCESIPKFIFNFYMHTDPNKSSRIKAI